MNVQDAIKQRAFREAIGIIFKPSDYPYPGFTDLINAALNSKTEDFSFEEFVYEEDGGGWLFSAIDYDNSDYNDEMDDWDDLVYVGATVWFLPGGEVKVEETEVDV